ncbi:L,D-transpeptidase [Synechococcus sp. BA-132 BA5]|uniref:L,D-transpeptidase n=1 Tax=Synechococcus sp. BA-132 BA5 TaxID=3110252 RepID=UPI002B1EBB68|nr:L,D-transpeptidase [Synechococcus sp. BA-132 BA5]MEA5414801.1 L,D-transpeptidase [Synechococcus sp. BA-132 BA5]
MKRFTGLALLALAWILAAPLGGPGRRALAVGTGSGQMVLVRTERQLPISGDPIWELQLLLPGQPARAYEALVGRARRQDGDRDRLGSKAPLPRGRYAVTEITPVEPTDEAELGRFLWIGLEPDFPTARRGLGIHHDPSAGRGRSSGTDGCIGLIHGNDLLVLGDLLRRSGTTELLVRD